MPFSDNQFGSMYDKYGAFKHHYFTSQYAHFIDGAFENLNKSPCDEINHFQCNSIQHQIKEVINTTNGGGGDKSSAELRPVRWISHLDDVRSPPSFSNLMENMFIYIFNVVLKHKCSDSHLVFLRAQHNDFFEKLNVILFCWHILRHDRSKKNSGDEKLLYLLDAMNCINGHRHIFTTATWQILIDKRNTNTLSNGIEEYLANLNASIKHKIPDMCKWHIKDKITWHITSLFGACKKGTLGESKFFKMSAKHCIENYHGGEF